MWDDAFWFDSALTKHSKEPWDLFEKASVHASELHSDQGFLSMLDMESFVQGRIQKVSWLCYEPVQGCHLYFPWQQAGKQCG
jgi:hypothetical protein